MLVLAMGALRAVYYRTGDGQEPVRGFIDELDVETQAALDNQIDRLGIVGILWDPLPFRCPPTRLPAIIEAWQSKLTSNSAATERATTSSPTSAPMDR
jgi:hypothetical protein